MPVEGRKLIGADGKARPKLSVKNRGLVVFLCCLCVCGCVCVCVFKQRIRVIAEYWPTRRKGSCFINMTCRRVLLVEDISVFIFIFLVM